VGQHSCADLRSLGGDDREDCDALRLQQRPTASRPRLEPAVGVWCRSTLDSIIRAYLAQERPQSAIGPTSEGDVGKNLPPVQAQLKIKATAKEQGVRIRKRCRRRRMPSDLSSKAATLDRQTLTDDAPLEFTRFIPASPPVQKGPTSSLSAWRSVLPTPDRPGDSTPSSVTLCHLAMR
jgi:hypothetical protein